VRSVRYTKDKSFSRIGARGKPIPLERKILLNSLFYDLGRNIHEVAKEARCSMPVLNRELFTTRDEWIIFKEKQCL